MRHRTRVSVILSIIIIVCGTFPLFVAAMTPDNFPYKADFTGPIVKNRLYRASLSPDVLDKCGDGCLRARIFDGTGREIPFVIYQENPGKSAANSRVFSVVSFEEEIGRSTMILKRQDATPEMVNRLAVSTVARDFHKEVIIEGSNDRIKWVTLGQDRIYDFTSRVPLRQTEMVIKENDFRFLRFTMKDSKEPDKTEKMKLRYGELELSTVGLKQKKTIGIDAFTAFFQRKETEALYDRSTVNPEIKNDEKARITEISFQTLVPVETIIFSIEDPFYLRTVAVYGSKTGKKEDVVRLASGTLHKLSIAGSEKVKDNIDTGQSSAIRLYRVIIENGTNPPLRITKTTVQWARRQLYFVAFDDNRQYTLYGGSPSATPVNYDLAAVVTADNRKDQPVEDLRLSPPRPNDSYRSSPDLNKKARIEKAALSAAVMLLVIVAGFFLYRLWKKA